MSSKQINSGNRVPGQRRHIQRYTVMFFFYSFQNKIPHLVKSIFGVLSVAKSDTKRFRGYIRIRKKIRIQKRRKSGMYPCTV